MPSYDFVRCESLQEAIELLENNKNAYPMAGGTDLIVGIRGGKFAPELLVDVKDIAELNVLKEDEDGITVGAAVTLNDAAGFAPLAEGVPILAQGCRSVGSYMIRNRATIAGNLCNASPAADTAAPLYCLDAVVNIAGPGGNRSLRVSDFLTGPGSSALEKGELVSSITVRKPYPPGKGVYIKASRTGSVDLATVGVAVQNWGKETRVAVGAVAPTPVRAYSVEKALNEGGEKDPACAAALVREDISPITDLRGSREYRFHIAEVLVRRGLEQTKGV